MNGPETPDPLSLTPGARWRILAATSFTTFISTSNSSALNVALPSIMRDLGADFAQVQWVIVIYLLFVTASLLVFGRLADALGKGRVNLIGVGLFSAGSLACGLAPGIGGLIAARAAQALGAAMMMATGPAIIADVFPAAERGSALGLQSTAIALGLTLGPPAGGFLLHAFSWRTIFHLNVPLGICALVLLWFILPADRQSGKRPPFDAAGAVLWITGLTAFMVFLLHGQRWSWLSRESALTGAAAAVLLLAFGFRQARAESPLLKLSLLRIWAFFTGTVSAFLSYVVAFMATFIMPFYLDHVRNLSPNVMGLVMSSLPMALLLVSGASGWASDRVGPRPPTVIGLAVVAVALFVCGRIGEESGMAVVAAGLFLLGAGMGIFQSPNTSALLGIGGQPNHGAVASLLATVRNLGMAMGIALGGALFSWRFGVASHGATLETYSPAHAPAFVSAMQTTFLAAAALAVLAMVLSSFRGAMTNQGHTAR
ncbi:MAG: MFS transporter [Deltaproteobacteria bacterium]|nr:MFS transporter [Deltaproteobacteria bacterium]